MRLLVQKSDLKLQQVLVHKNGIGKIFQLKQNRISFINFGIDKENLFFNILSIFEYHLKSSVSKIHFACEQPLLSFQKIDRNIGVSLKNVTFA